MAGAAPSEIILGEAADWLMRFQSGDATPGSRRAFEQWRARSAEHQAAWQRAETVLGTFGHVPGEVGHKTLQGLAKPGRRHALRALGVFALAAPTAWIALRQLPWNDWHADLRTARGEQKRFVLADGTRLVLNTASAVDVLFTRDERRLWLHSGELLIVTAPDPAPVHRPFIVETAQGTTRALGTRFSVRLEANRTHVAVVEGAVEIRPCDSLRASVLDAGSRTSFDSRETASLWPVDASAMQWEQGMLIAQDMRLGDLVAELARYRTGVLRCHADVANMRVSGAFPLGDTDASLRLLQKTLPLRVSSATRYWVTVESH